MPQPELDESEISGTPHVEEPEELEQRPKYRDGEESKLVGVRKSKLLIAENCEEQQCHPSSQTRKPAQVVCKSTIQVLDRKESTCNNAQPSPKRRCMLSESGMCNSNFLSEQVRSTETPAIRKYNRTALGVQHNRDFDTSGVITASNVEAIEYSGVMNRLTPSLRERALGDTVQRDASNSARGEPVSPELSGYKTTPAKSPFTLPGRKKSAFSPLSPSKHRLSIVSSHERFKKIHKKRFPQHTMLVRSDFLHGEQKRDEGTEDDVQIMSFQRCSAPAPKPSKLFKEHLDKYRVLETTWGKERDVLDASIAAAVQQKEDCAAKLLECQLMSDHRSFEHELAMAKMKHKASELKIAQEHTQMLFQRLGICRRSLSSPAAPVSQRDVEVADEVAKPFKTAGIITESGSGAVDLLDSTDESDKDSAMSDEAASDDDVEAGLQCSQRALSGSMVVQYNELCRLQSAASVVSHPRSNVTISSADFSTMAPGSWIGDACINMYMSLLQDRDKEWFHAGSDRPRCLLMNTHFVSKMCQEAGGYDYSKVSRWTGPRKLKAQQLNYYRGIEDLDKLVVPVHLGNHWTCAVVNFRDRQLEYYDSLGGVDRNTVSSLMRWVEDEYADKYKKPLPDRFKVKGWKQVFNPPGTPRQKNGSDCGLFSIMCCKYTSADKMFDYDQAQIYTFFRALCTLECFYMKLRSADL